MVNFYFLDAKLVIIFRLNYELYNFTVVLILPRITQIYTNF